MFIVLCLYLTDAIGGMLTISNSLYFDGIHFPNQISNLGFPRAVKNSAVPTLN